MTEKCICTNWGWPWCETTVGCPVHDPPKCAHCKDTGVEPEVGDDMTPEVPCEECQYDENYSRFYEMKP